ncbi:MAG: hypothetical protein Rubg2KO_21620 [Rubricoccaceae bacterium]
MTPIPEEAPVRMATVSERGGMASGMNELARVARIVKRLAWRSKVGVAETGMLLPPTPPDLMTLSDALAALDTTRTSILADLDAFTPEQRVASPAEGAWSPEQVAEHVLTAERGILASIRRSTDAHLGTPSQQAVEGVISFMKSDQKAQTPPFLEPQGMAYDDARQGLGTVGADWHELVDSLSDAPQDRAVFAHPMAGPMTLLDTLRFMESHAGHHRHQLARIRASESVSA